MKWQDIEIEKLRDLAGNYPATELVRRFKQWAKYKALPPRSESCIRAKCSRLGLSIRPHLEQMTLRCLARTLEISYQTVYSWYLDKRIKAVKKGGYLIVTPADFKKFAKANKKRLAGVDEFILFGLLESQSLVQSIKEHTPKAVQYKVVDKKKGVVYSSLQEAAKRNNYSSTFFLKNNPDYHLIPTERNKRKAVKC